jgi:hypothetical protein
MAKYKVMSGYLERWVEEVEAPSADIAIERADGFTTLLLRTVSPKRGQIDQLPATIIQDDKVPPVENLLLNKPRKAK